MAVVTKALATKDEKPAGGASGSWSRVSEIAMDIGKEAVHHLEIMYPAAIAACPDTMKLSLRNHIHNEIMAALETTDAEQIRARLRRRQAQRRATRANFAALRGARP